MADGGPCVMIVGQIARDLVVVVDGVPRAHGTAPVRRRVETLGGKGANQAVALAQLGVRVGLVAVAGDDRTGTGILDRARRDGVDVEGVIRRPGTATGLIVDVVDADGHWRYLEDLPEPVLLTGADVRASAGRLRAADWVGVQLQQPAEAVRAAVGCAREGGARVVLDGVPAGDAAEREALLGAVDVVRADSREAALIAGSPIDDADAGLGAARDILSAGPGLVALAVAGVGNVVAWNGGELVLPLIQTPVADTTGAGDAFTAALITVLSRGGDAVEAARWATAAAAATVGHPGGRPRLGHEVMRHHLRLVDEAMGGRR